MTAVPLNFDAATTATYAAITSNVAGSPPIAGVIGQKTVWAFLLDTTCPADVTDITVEVDLTAWVLAGGIGYGDSDGISIQLLDVGGPVQVPWTSTVGGDLYTAPGNNGTVRVGYLAQGGTTSGPGIVSVTATGISGVVGPLALGIIADMQDSVGQPGNLIEIATPTVAEVTFAPGSPCAPEPLPCVEIPVTFDQAATDAIAAAFGADPSTDPTGPLATAGVGSSNAMWVGLVEIPPGCDTEVVSVEIASTVDVSAGMDSGTDGAGITVAETPATPAPWGTVTATDGDVSVIAPQMLSTGYVDIGGTAWPALPATIPLAGTYSGGPLPASTLAVVAYADALSAESVPGSTIKVNVPQTVCVTFSSPDCPPATDPIPVDDTASTTTGTTITVDAAANDNNTPCDPLPGCAVYREGVPFIDPGSTATGITASVDAAGEVTFAATGPGVAVLNVESGCSPTCDPNGADVTTWVAQTVTITVTEPVVPCPTQLVKNCLAETPIVGCAEFGGVPTATILHSVVGANGDVIPVGSIAHPATNGVGSDGSGFIRSYFTDADGAVVTPDAGTFTPGPCATGATGSTFTAGAVSIGSGAYAGVLDPDGSSWSAPTGLRSVTIAARRSDTANVTGGASNRIDVVLTTGTFRLLEGETFTWSVDDPDTFVVGSVNCIGDAAAAVVWVAL